MSPIYPMSCPKCGEFDVIQKINDPKMEVCPTCGSPVERLIASTGSFKIDGGGVYSPGSYKGGPQKSKPKSNVIRIKPEDIE